MKYIYKKQISFSIPPKNLLPKGFQYPEGYLTHSKTMGYPLQFLWDFIDHEEHDFIEWKCRLNPKINGWSALANIDPIPFARNGDWAAHFDGNDHSGDPIVVVIDLGNKAHGYTHENFSDWLDDAKMKSGIGDPPYDKVRYSNAYPMEAEQSDGYHFCPNCFEANQPLKEYDQAIRCESCDTLFNIKS